MDSKNKILITEDRNDFSQDELAGVLSLGFTPIFCRKDGEEVIERIVNDKPQIVLMDLFMSRLDSIGVMKSIDKNISGNKPLFVVSSSFDSPVLQREVMESGASYFVIKPFSLKSLCENLTTLLRLQSTEGIIHNLSLSQSSIELKVTEIIHMDKIRIPGIHNVENYLAAIAAVWGEVTVDVIKDMAENFGGVEHRIEFVRELDGVKWYNDSIATSPTRVLAGLNSFSQKLIVIAGGYDKKIPFEPMAETVNQKVKKLILMGVTAQKIEKAITECPSYSADNLEIHHVSSMEEAVKKAQEISESGDIVTLSPACASFDLYPNFEARGIHYKNLVKEL